MSGLDLTWKSHVHIFSRQFLERMRPDFFMLTIFCFVSELYVIQSLRELNKWRAKGTLLTTFYFFLFQEKKLYILPNKKEMWVFSNIFVPLFIYFKAKKKI